MLTGDATKNLEQMKVDSYNESEGQLTGYDCPICKNRGNIAVIGENGMFAIRDCDCLIRRRNLKKLRESGLEELLEEYTMEAYETGRPWQKSAKEKALHYVEDGKGWFVISGNPGTGKTHLCTAICGKLLEQSKSVRYMLWREEAPRLKACVNDSEKYEKLIGDYKTCDVLYIDDFWKGTVTDADINLSFELLNSRYNDRRKLTIISGEKDIEQMLEIDEAIGSRIYERSKGNLIKTPNENYRLR